MRIVIAPDKFKGSLAAQSVAHSIAEGVLQVAPRATTILAPMADGGEGTAEVLAAARPDARVMDFEVTGPLPEMRVRARVFLLDGDTAVLDMASAAGHSLLSDSQREPLRTTTYGVGELVRHAAEQGVARIVIGLGGSATLDAGIGAAQALGAKIELEDGPLTRPFTGADLGRIKSIDFAPAGIGEIEVICLYDVDNPLHGRRGAAPVFGPQKGAGPRQVQQFDVRLRNLAEKLDGWIVAETPGMGAAGGLGFGLHYALNARLRPGSQVVAEAIGLDEKLRGADLCFTGEGGFDATSLGGKVTTSVARRCSLAGVPCFVLAGSVQPGLVMAHEHGVTSFQSILPGPMSADEARPRTHAHLAEAAEQVMRIFLAGRWIFPSEEVGA